MKEIINRKIYKEVKKKDRQQMESFLQDIHTEGYKQGFKDGSEAGEQADFQIKLYKVLQATKGIGDKTISKVLKTLKEMEG